MITLEQQPYAWSARGQKLIYRASSDQTTQTGFKYIVRVTDVSNTRNYEFLYDPTPFDEKLYFDLNPLVYLRNWENDSGGKYIVPHYTPTHAPTEEPESYGYARYDVEIGEGWLINGIFTENPDEGYEPVDAEQVYIYNAYLQAFYDFRPNPETGIAPVNFSLTDLDSYAWSDRWLYTSPMPSLPTIPSVSWDPDWVYIPTYISDWGAIACEIGGTVLSNNEAVALRIVGIDLFGTSSQNFSFSDYNFSHVGIYPQNLNISTSTFNPVTNPNWVAYQAYFINSSGQRRSKIYVFYNAAQYGQHDCKNDIIRIAWVSMRGGWDYFNFIKRSEITNQVDRKQFTRRLNNNSTKMFFPNQRQTIDTINLNERILTVNSDWVSENEFIYLKNLFNSNQVQWLTKTTLYPLQGDLNVEPEQAVPVSLVDTTFIEQRGRNGKKVNVTLKFKITQDYWT
jgi:hypothetical protein